MKINIETAGTYAGPLSKERQADIVDHLKDMGEFRQQRAVAVMIQNGGDEAGFAKHLIGGAAPEDKRAHSMQTK